MPVPGSLAAPVTTGLALGQTLLMVLLPHGGQLSSRRNAWAGLAADASRARARREAQAAVDLAVSASAARLGERSRTGSR